MFTVNKSFHLPVVLFCFRVFSVFGLKSSFSNGFYFKAKRLSNFLFQATLKKIVILSKSPLSSVMTYAVLKG